MSVLQLAALVVAGIACVTDIRSRRVPNWLTFSAAATGLVAHTILPTGHGALWGLGGLLAGLAVFFPFFALGGLGAGDVKLMAALGSWLGWSDAIWTALYGSMAGGVLGILVGLATGYLGQALANLRGMLATWYHFGLRPIAEHTLAHSKSPRLPYAIPIFVGLLVTLWQQ